MTIFKTPPTFVILILASLSVGGCSTPAALTTLTKETGDNAVALSVALSNLEKKSKSTADIRIASAARLSGVIDRVEFRRRRNKEMIKAYEDADAWSAYEAIIKRTDGEVMKIKAAAESSENARKSIAEKLVPLDSDADELRNLGADLLKFSKEDSKFDRGRFFVDFVAGVIKDLEKSDESGDKAKNKAEMAVKKAEAEVKNASNRAPK